MFKYALVIIVGLLLFSSVACDKIKVPGNIAGRVFDENGAARGLMTVQLVDATSGKVITQETSDDLGNYFFTKVDPGKYKLLTLKGGTTEVPNDSGEVNLGPGKTLTVEITLLKVESSE
jgi:hypothetical protein